MNYRSDRETVCSSTRSATFPSSYLSVNYTYSVDQGQEEEEQLVSVIPFNWENLMVKWMEGLDGKVNFEPDRGRYTHIVTPISFCVI